MSKIRKVKRSFSVVFLNAWCKNAFVFFALISFTSIHSENLTTKYIWNLGLAIDCDISPYKKGLSINFASAPPPLETEPSRYINRVKKGDLIWVQSARLPSFFYEVLPYIDQPFSLVINDGDAPFPIHPSPYYNENRLINDPRVIHIFAQNVSIKDPHPKISHIPIGIDFHTVANSRDCVAFGEVNQSTSQQEQVLEEILSRLQPTYLRQKRVFAEFQLSDRGFFDGESRLAIFERLSLTGLLDAPIGRLPRHEMWEKKGQYAFSISPRGFGLDCHRTWEDLVLGCIVIVKTSSLDPLFEGLPVVIVKDWSEITEKNFDLWIEQYGDAFTNPKFRERLTHAYWMNFIRSKAAID